MKPQLVLHVEELERSHHFYSNVLGWEIEWQNAQESVVQLKRPDGSPMIVTDRAELDIKPYMDVVYAKPTPGKRFYVTAKDLISYQKELAQKGYETKLEIEDGFGQTLLVEDPDGFIVSFWEELFMSDADIIDLYRKGSELLQAALEGLAEQDYDLVRAPGKWSIRQTVLHLIDSDISTMLRMKFALAEPGRHYARNAYSPDAWADGTDYAGRTIDTEIALFTYARIHILNLCQHIPEALDRTVMVEGRGNEQVRKMMKMVAGHARGHINQILETRVVHGK